MRGIGAKIKARRVQLGWSTVKLATLVGVSQSFLWRIEEGKANGSWETYTKIAGALGCSLDTLIGIQGNVEAAPLGTRRIPVLDYVQAGRWMGVDGTPQDADVEETILVDLELPPSIFALRIRGDSMEPEFLPGDIVVIAPTVAPIPGDYVVATDESGEATFKKYRHIGRNERGIDVFELVPLNESYAPMRSDRHHLAIVGTMVERRRRRR